MIQFYAQLYNASTSEPIDSTQKVYTIGEYLGYRDPDSEIGTDIMFEKAGQTINNLIPLSTVEYDITTNVGGVINDTAHRLHQTLGYYPVLRFLKTSEVDDNYLEWNPANPNGFNIKVDGALSRWEYTFLWNESSVLPRITFIKANNTADLLSTDIHYSGCVEISGNAPCLVGSVIGKFTCDLPQLTTEKIFYDQEFALSDGGSYPYQFNTLITGGTYNYYYGVVIKSVRSEGGLWSVHAYAISPSDPGQVLITHQKSANGNENLPLAYNSTYKMWVEYLRVQTKLNAYIKSNTPLIPKEVIILETDQKIKTPAEGLALLASTYNFRIDLISSNLYEYLMKHGGVVPEEPDSDVDPDDIPPEDEPPIPPQPDNPDPYYDPSSDPDSPDYDPTKDPSSPDYDPDVPHPPFNPPSTEGGGGDPSPQPPQDEIPAPETPPSYVTTNALFTLYNPAAADLTNLANFLWSPAWSIDTFKKIFANPLDCILGLMVMPYLAVDVATKNMNVGNIDTGVAMRYFTKQFYDYDCGDFTIEEFYKAYLDYAPYTKVSIFLPYIGDQQLNTDEVMGKTLNVKYRFDLATGDCVAFVSVDGSVLYSFSGNCAARLPLSSNNYGGLLPSITGAIVAAGSMAAGVPALGAASALAVSSMKQDIRHTGSISGSAGLMGVQTPYLIITRPRQALPIGQNSFMGYPSFITESLGGLTGYTEVESCHLEHVPCTDEELREIENLLKGGVLF